MTSRIFAQSALRNKANIAAAVRFLIAESDLPFYAVGNLIAPQPPPPSNTGAYHTGRRGVASLSTPNRIA
jgi:hypothetical protein